MKYLKQTLLIFILMGVTMSQVFAHSGAHHMGFFEGIVHFISSSIHLAPIFLVISVLVVLKIYRVWTR